MLTMLVGIALGIAVLLFWALFLPWLDGSEKFWRWPPWSGWF